MTLADVPAVLDLVRVGRAIRSGGTTSVRLTEECLLAIATWNSALRAFITVREERALDTAREADRELAAGYDRGPLHGIPISLKDIIDLAGTPTTAASDATSRDPVAADALVTRRLKAAGAIIVGKTNLHEFALGTTSDQSAYGTIRNPLDHTRSAGGSSGGAAVSVVMRMAVAAIGTDTGGSIRIPAAACGVVGLKPAFGEVPTDGVMPLSTSLDHVGPLAGSVADAAAVYQVLARTAARRLTARAASGLRLGRLGGYIEAKLHPDVRAGYESALERITGAGVAIRPHAASRAAVPHIALPNTINATASAAIKNGIRTSTRKSRVVSIPPISDVPSRPATPIPNRISDRVDTSTLVTASRNGRRYVNNAN